MRPNPRWWLRAYGHDVVLGLRCHFCGALTAAAAQVRKTR
jgi:hypothetical protein